MPTSGSFNGQHTFGSPGVYTVTVSLSDEHATVERTFSVTVVDVAPTLVVAPNQVTAAGSLLPIANIGQFTDPAFGNSNFTYTIDWGDGLPADTGAATITTPGTPSTPTAGSFNGSHTYATPGVYTVTVTLDDHQGGISSGTLTVTVNEVPPTLVVVPNQTVFAGQPLTLNPIGTFSDPAFDNLLNVGGQTQELFTYAIDWGDGTTVDSGPGVITTEGSPGVPTSGSFNGQHTFGSPGVYTVTVSLSDEHATVERTFSVTVVDVAPTLVVAPNQVTAAGSLLPIANIGQFTDPAFGNSNFYLAITIDWGDGLPADTGAATITTPGTPSTPTAGSFNGSHTYATPGVYTVTVTLDDHQGGISSGTLTVTVNEVPPTLVVVPNQTVFAGQPLTLNPIGTFSDPAFDNLLNVGGQTQELFTYAIDWGDGTTVDSGPGVITTEGSPGVPTSGSFNGQHVYATPGVYTVTVSLSDEHATVQGTFSVTVHALQLTLTPAPNQTVDQGSLLSVASLGQFTDPAAAAPSIPGLGQAETYTFAVNWGDGLPASTGASEVITTQGASGVATRRFVWRLAHVRHSPGVYTVTETIFASDGRSVTRTLEVTVRDVPPTLETGPNRTVVQGDPLAIPNIGTFTDPGFSTPLNVGGQTTESFTYLINWGDGTTSSIGPVTSVVEGAPGVLTTGAFNGVHTFPSTGHFTVTVTVSDNDGGTAVQTFSVLAGVVPTAHIPLATVDWLPPPALFGVAAADQVVRVTDTMANDPRPVGLTDATRIDFQRFRFGSVAGAESRLVLRLVSPAGVEDKNNDQTLPVATLDNLRKLFHRLPDGNYRIYQIRPDGDERLVVDVIVREGRSIDSADESEGTDDSAPPEKQPEPAPAEGSAELRDKIDAEPADWAATTALTGGALGGYVAVAASGRGRRRIRRDSQRADERPLSKARRLLRRLK